mmetsp:Transcript_127503/g.291385  ORF Transcript_127503/g.291385 Transcript_127503/m.291385 type:complete len:267 (-) Transcript_127503:9-809(-)
MASNAKSAPSPSVNFFTSFNRLWVLLFTTWVAPNFLACSSFSSLMSAAIMVLAPAIRAPCRTFRPTPPVPMQRTVDPGVTCALLNTEHTPVVTPHPTKAAFCSGMSFAILIAESMCTVQYSAMHPRPQNGTISSPPAPCRRTPPLGKRLVRLALRRSHSVCLPLAHALHLPHTGTKERTTGSPTSNPTTPGPTAQITPAPSCPRTRGAVRVSRPLRLWASDKQTPQAATWTCTSSAWGGSIVMVSTASSLRTTTARHCLDMAEAKT